jgi:Peptidase family M28/PDZ domain/PA domain
VPEGGGLGYNSYDGLDVKEKIVLLLRYVPEGVDAKRRAQLNRYAGLRYKAMMARERGAKAVLVVTGPNSPGAGEILPLGGDGTLAGSGVLAASISGAVADALLAQSGTTLKDLQSGLDTENPHATTGLAIPKVRAKVSIGVEHIKDHDSNVVAVIPPVGTDEYVVVGAHYDHLGLGKTGSSLGRAGEEGRVHPGADDNASGVAAIMEIAAAVAADDVPAFRRGIIFGCWSGEEIGLIGSAAFCAKPPVPIAKIAAYFNFDMVGRLRDNKLTLQGVGSSKVWRRLIEKRNVAAGFDLTLQDDPYLPTDTTSFYPKRVPVLNFFTGAHEDYHRPTDTAEKLEFAGLERIAEFARALVLDVATAKERPDLSRVERKADAGGSRETLRAYLGTIPDYTTEIKGVKFSGVRAGSPAEKGGMKGGDILVEFAGQKITNIYDYTYALDAVKIGTPVALVVERDGKRVELTVTPEARR